MKSYTLVISGQDHVPTLLHTFEIGSDRMAREYASKQAPVIASDKYFYFSLFRTNGDQQEHLCEWQVRLTPKVVEGA